MPTISTRVSKRLKDKLTVKARKQGKPVSEIVKEALNKVDSGRQEYTEVDDKSKTKEEEVVPPILKELNNLSTRIGEIENTLVELGKVEVCLGEIITHRVLDHEKKRYNETEREDANRIYLHNLVIRALEEITDKNLAVCKSNHPRLSE